MFTGMSTIPETSGTSAMAAPLSAVPSTRTSSLERYLAQIADPVLRENISREIAGMGRTFGLVFERHHPEGIRLPKHRVRRGSKVIINTEKNSGYYRVSRLAKDDGTALLVDDAGNQSIYPIDQLTVAKEFGDVMHPGLRKLSEVRNGAADAPVHTIINGENYHALEALQYTHSGKVDLIYIDPPYNTGGNSEWKYNDQYVDGADGYRHSKWLSFMEKRLRVAKTLLSPQGMIYVSIDDNEMHRLHMLLDQVFGERNSHGLITWKKRHVPINIGAARHRIQPKLEYVLAYSRCPRDEHPGFDTSGGTDFIYPFSDAEGDYRTVGFTNSNKGASRRDNLVYPILGVDPPAGKQWKIGREKAAALLEADRLRLVDGSPKIIAYSHEEQGSSVRTYWSHLDETVGTASDGKKSLKGLLGEDHGFDTVKPIGLIQELLRRERNKSAVVLDFFGGSGTTADAVIRLNAEDGGTRQAILVTNNELSKKEDEALREAGHAPGDTEYEALGVFHHVTKPRLETVITGVRPDGSAYSDGLAANAAFFELTYLDEPEIVTGKALNDLAGLFWLKSGGTGGTVEITAGAKADGYAISESGSTAILFSPGRARALAEQLRADGQDITNIFIVTDSEAQGDEAASHFSTGINVERIYGSYLEAFQVNRKD